MDWDLQLWFLGGAVFAQLVRFARQIEVDGFQLRHKLVAYWLVRALIAILLSFAFVASTYKNPLGAFIIGASAIPLVRLADRIARQSLTHTSNKPNSEWSFHLRNGMSGEVHLNGKDEAA